MNLILDKKLFFSMTYDYLNKYIVPASPDKEDTKNSYRDALTIFRRYVSQDLGLKASEFKFSDLSYDFVLDYRDALSKKYVPSTVNHRLTVLKSYIGYAAERLVDLQPLYISIMKVPSLKGPEEILPTIDEEVLLAEYLDSPGQSDKGLRDRAVLSILYDTAIRVDELVGLDLCCVCLRYDIPYIHVHGKGSRDRKVCLHDNTAGLLRQYIEVFHPGGENFAFFYTTIKGQKSRMSKRNAQRIVQKYWDMLREHHPELSKHASPHMLRRTRATGWYNDGVSIETIALLLGHSQTQTTKKHYAKPSLKVLAEETSKGDDAISGHEKALWEDDDEFSKMVGLR